jgi:hypothetical protein
MNIFRANSPAGTQTTSIKKFRSAARLLTFAAVAAFAFTSASNAFAACTGGSALKGRFSVLVAGGTTAGNSKYVDGTMTFDGACGINGFVSIGENGTANNFVGISGTYSTNPDNTLSLSLALPNGNETYDVGVSSIFGEALGIETDGTAYATIDLKPQVAPVVNSAPVTNYNNATIKGNWAAMCTAATGQVDLVYVSIDGASNYQGVFGTITGTEHIYVSGPQVLSAIGHYAVLSDGTFGGSLAVGGAYPFGFTGSVTNNGNEIQYNVIQGSGVIQACSAKRVS